MSGSSEQSNFKEQFYLKVIHPLTEGLVTVITSIILFGEKVSARIKNITPFRRKKKKMARMGKIKNPKIVRTMV